MTYRRTQRACRFADRGKKNLRGGSRGWREPICPERLPLLVRGCSRVPRRVDPLSAISGTETNVCARVTEKQTSWFRLGATASTRSLQRHAAFRFEGNATTDGIKIVLRENRSKVLRPCASRVPSFVEIRRRYSLRSKTGRRPPCFPCFANAVVSGPPRRNGSATRSNFCFIVAASGTASVVVRFPRSPPRGKK